MKKIIKLVLSIVLIICISLINITPSYAKTVSGNEINEDLTDTVSGQLISEEISDDYIFEDLILEEEAGYQDYKYVTSDCVHVATITSDGLLYMWGAGAHSQLGNDDNGKKIPTRVLGIRNVISVDTGRFHTIAATADGSVYTWGEAGAKLGYNTGYEDVQYPTKVDGISDVVKVYAGTAHSAAITSNGDLYTWGNGSDGRLGHGGTADYYRPKKVNGISNVVDVALADTYTLVLTQNGNVYAFGRCVFGETGLGYDMGNEYTPKRISALSNVVSISAESGYAAAVTSNGKVYTWGINYNGRLGLNQFDNYESHVPTLVSGISNVASIELGQNHVLALCKDGTIYAWGKNYYGQYGDGADLYSYTPKKINTITGVIQISASEESSYAITNNGNLYTWGCNCCNELGDGSGDEYRYLPKRIAKKPVVVDGTADFVDRLYEVALGRKADNEGFYYWYWKLCDYEASAAEVAQGFIFSQEFKNKNYNYKQYVSTLYRTMFGRNADNAGLNGWVSDMQNGMSREYIYRGFAESQEFSNLCNRYGVIRGEVTLNTYRDRNAGATGFIARLYTKMLGRNYDENGLEYWCMQYHTGANTIEEIATNGFLHSQELQNMNLSDKEFVTRMYRTFLNREPDKAGLNDWVNRLRTGQVTRDSLVYGFTRSAEFGKIKASYGL